MKNIILAIALLVGFVSAKGIVGPGENPCGPNESFLLCGECDPVCPGVNRTCAEGCTAGCFCDPPLVRNKDNICVKEKTCPRVLTCGENEVLNECNNPCEEEKCATLSTVEEICPIPMECVPGCSCKKGFFRNAQGECVRECKLDPCAAIRCAIGSTCVLGHCQPTQHPCATIKCAIGSQCVVVENCRRGVCTSVGECQPMQNYSCGITMKCPAGSECVLGQCQPTQNGCDKKECAYNEECVMVDVDCVQGPCPPIPECRPKILPDAICEALKCPNQCAMVFPANCDGKECQPSSQCVDANPCHWTRCSPGYQCVLQASECEKQPHTVCQPIKTEVANCVMVKPWSCTYDEKRCTPVLRCIEEDPCLMMHCGRSTRCVLYESDCKEKQCAVQGVCEVYKDFIEISL